MGEAKRQDDGGLPRIFYTKPSITDREVAYATDAAANGWGADCYAYIDRFEAAFREHLGSRYAIATSSCTGAIHMGLAALGIGPGDEVILADTNWIATVSPIVHLGATPVLVDIDPSSWCIDPDCAQAAITPRTKAIIATHLYGNLADLDRLAAIADEHGIALIEDAAEAIGSVWKGQRAGSIGRFGTFSFHGTKTVTTGEGGMFVTDDADLFHDVLTLSNHGRVAGDSRQFWPSMVGYKFKMSNIQAALGVGQMERISDLITRKRAILSAYKERLLPLGLAMNPEPSGCRIGGWMPTVVFPAQSGVSRDQAKEALNGANIDARVFFHPLSSLGLFPPCPDNRHAHDIAARAINLPSYHDMTEGEIDRVADAIAILLDRSRSRLR